jgi:hypothetical protein
MAIYKVLPAQLPAFISAAARANCNCVIGAIAKTNLQLPLYVVVHSGNTGYKAAPIVKQLAKWALPIATCQLQTAIAAQWVKTQLHNTMLYGTQQAIAFNLNAITFNGVNINWQ